MESKSQRQKGYHDARSSLNSAIDALNLARGEVATKPAKDVLYSASILLMTIRNSMINEGNFVELGLACTDACKALHRGMGGNRALDHLSQPVLIVVEQLTATVDEMQKHIVKRGKRNAISRRFHARDDEEAIATWRLVLDQICHVLETESGITAGASVVDVHRDGPNGHTSASYLHHEVLKPGVSNTHTAVSDAYRDVVHTHHTASEVRSGLTGTRTVTSSVNHDASNNHKEPDTKERKTHASAPGEFPPPQPRSIPGPITDIRRDVRKACTIISEVQRDVVEIQQILNTPKDNDKDQVAHNNVSGETPPPPPRIFFGRDDLIEEIVGFAEQSTPIALIGAGGIGKTSIALTVLHDDRIKQRFGDNRRFIRCDRFPASLTHFLRRLSSTIGTGIENPGDLTSIRPFLSSREMFIILDNAESILDPEGVDAQEICGVVDELSCFKNICLCVTSRISTIPSGFETLEIPTLSAVAACETFYRIYKHGKRSDLVKNILKQLDFHPLSITLLATVAHHNKWGVDRLAREWESRRTGVLETKHKLSLATTIELSLSSPMFQELGPNARGLLGVIAFYPQGIDEKNLDWLFPTISNTAGIFDGFCALSLTYRSEGSVKMLAPLRDYLSPRDPLSSSLLCITRDSYFSRMSTLVNPNRPEFVETRWIMSEDANVEHLLDIFTSIDGNSDNVWGACARLLVHLYWHKPRAVILGPKIEGLPDDHHLKPECLFQLSRLLQASGNYPESKRLQTHTLKLWRDRGNLGWVGSTLLFLSNANMQMHLLEEGIQLAKEALEVYVRLNDTVNQGQCLLQLAQLLHSDNQLDAAEETASRAITLLPEDDHQFIVCGCHRVLGNIYHFKGDEAKAIEHLEVALRIASSHDNWNSTTFWIYYTMVVLYSEQGRIGDAYAHLERAKPHALNDAHNSAYAMVLQAHVWYYESRLEEAESEALRALDAFERLGATEGVERCRRVISKIREEMRPVPLIDLT